MHTDFLSSTKAVFQSYKTLGERSLQQVSDEALSLTVNNESNSIAVIVKHLYGNMLSRWTDFLTTDGEKEWRDRDAEFEVDRVTREQLMQWWNDGWKCLFENFDALTEEDLQRVVRIRAEKHSALEAIQRQVGHTAYHVGQIVYLAKMFSLGNWQTLTVARGMSKQFNEDMLKKHAES